MLKVTFKQAGPLVLTLFLLASVQLFSAEFVYVIDTSASMKVHRSAAKDRLLEDVRRHFSPDSTALKAGDHVHVWSFNGEVLERLEFAYTPEFGTAILKEIQSKLKKVKAEGPRTSLARPIIRALERFLAAEHGRLNLFIYTDGKDQLSQTEIEHILRLYNHNFKIGQRLGNAYLVHFGTDELPKETQNLIATLGGRVIPSMARFDLDLGKSVISAPSPASPPPTSKPADEIKNIIVSVTPTSIGFSVEPAVDLVKAIPIQFEVTPTQPGLSIGVAVEMSNLPDGMTVGTVSDRIALEGRQSIALAIQNGSPGLYEGKIVLNGAADIRPRELPLKIEVVRPHPEKIKVEFYPERLPQLKFTSGPEWHRVSGLGMVLVFPESLPATQARFRWNAPSGTELRIAPAGNATNSFAVDQWIAVSAIGRVVVFDIRQPHVGDGTSTAGTLSLELEPTAAAQVEGKTSVIIPFEFTPAFEVRLDTRDLPLGDLSREVKSIRKNLVIHTKGDLDGRKIRISKQSQSLGAINVSPNELDLTPGAMSIDLEFSGLDAHPEGPIHGTILLVPDGVSSTNLTPYTVTIRGSILKAPKLFGEVANTMVAGQPLVIRARLETGEKGAAVVASVQPPNSSQLLEIPLADTGFSDHGDLKEGDGVYSGVLQDTQELGAYKITVMSKNPVVQSAPLTAPIYFRGPVSPLSGRLVNRKQGGQGEFLELSCSLESDYPGEIAVSAEPVGLDPGLNTFVSMKRLKRGQNTVNFVVGLTQESRPGTFKYHVDLLTEPLHDAAVRIPVQLEVRVLSFFQYFLRLAAVTLGIAVAILLVFFGPWRRSRSRYASRSSVTEAMRAQDQEPIDYR